MGRAKRVEGKEVTQGIEVAPDLKVWGDEDLFTLLSKVSSKEEGWVKTTEAMEIPGVGCVVQVTTERLNADGTYSLASALGLVPRAKVVAMVSDSAVIGRKLAFNPYILK